MGAPGSVCLAPQVIGQTVAREPMIRPTSKYRRIKKRQMDSPRHSHDDHDISGPGVIKAVLTGDTSSCDLFEGVTLTLSGEPVNLLLLSEPELNKMGDHPDGSIHFFA
jgi:hypothetical protein